MLSPSCNVKDAAALHRIALSCEPSRRGGTSRPGAWRLRGRVEDAGEVGAGVAGGGGGDLRGGGAATSPPPVEFAAPGRLDRCYPISGRAEEP